MKTKVPYSKKLHRFVLRKKSSPIKANSKKGKKLLLYQMHRYQRKDMGNMKKQGNMKPPKEHNNSPETYSNMKNSQNLRRIKIIDIKEVK